MRIRVIARENFLSAVSGTADIAAPTRAATKATRYPRRHPACAVLAYVLGVPTLLIMALRFLPAPLDHVIPIPALVSAIPWLVIPALLALVGRRWVVALLMAACLVLQAAWQAPFYLDTSHRLPQAAVEQGERGGSTLRVMTLNAYFGQADVEQIVRLVEQQGVDVLALEEVTAEMTARLDASALPGLLPYRVGGSTGQQIWSSLPLYDEAADEVGFRVSPMCAATVRVGDEELRFVAVHTTAPVRTWGAQWASSIELVGTLADEPYRQGEPRYVLMGDFNATYDHRVFREMLGDRFSDAARSSGAGIDFTWPASLGGVSVPQLISIDHVILDEGVLAAQMQTVTVEGTDHQALLFTIGVDPTA